MFKKILVTLDGSSVSLQVLPLVKQLLDGGGDQEVILFMAAEPPQATPGRRKGLRRPLPSVMSPMGAFPGGVMLPASPPVYAESRDQAVERREHELLEYLEDASRTLSDSGCLLHAAVQFGEPVKEIVDFAKQERIDLIVMATHGRSGLRETLQGSVTAEVIRSGVAPVLVLRPRSRRNRRRA